MFEPNDWPTEQVPDSSRYALHRRRDAVVDLFGMHDCAVPQTSLMRHSCDQLMVSVKRAEILVDAVRPSTQRHEVTILT